jgi:predicted nucleic acid-binding protein
MILVDTNVLVALAEPRDALNPRAVADLRRLAGKPMMLTQEVLTEAFALMVSLHGRARLCEVILALDCEPCPQAADRPFLLETFEWLRRYADHEPDWTDAVLAVLAGRISKSRVWTYDREFSALWRTPRGSAIPLAGSNPGK